MSMLSIALGNIVGHSFIPRVSGRIELFSEMPGSTEQRTRSTSPTEKPKTPAKKLEAKALRYATDPEYRARQKQRSKDHAERRKMKKAQAVLAARRLEVKHASR